MSEKCPFCHPEQFIKPHLAEHGLYPALDKIPVLETDRMVVTPDVLAVSPDFHLILYTREDHLASFASSPELQEEVGGVLHSLGTTIEKPIIFVEHGGVAGLEKPSTVQTVSHRHAHILPGELRLIDFLGDVLDGMKIDYTRFVSYDSSPLAAMTGFLECQQFGYLFAQDINTGRGLVAFDQENIWPSQITQRNVAQLLSGRELNWKIIGEDQELAQLSVQRIISMHERFGLL